MLALALGLPVWRARETPAPPIPTGRLSYKYRRSSEPAHFGRRLVGRAWSRATLLILPPFILYVLLLSTPIYLMLGEAVLYLVFLLPLWLLLSLTISAVWEGVLAALLLWRRRTAPHA
ncbi:hypothetical protein K7W42_14225 [Deinococcus sp. HMF7604]|uniref:hypothetical protein n=1 Tax=Deinococcus betulae TaxID=2873312 RepID=UPI001CCA9830|nr:hypothetical protein [Deinococcus betulae]MBZ9752014.1 hypothetical protein [Deinococcus betulae]